MPARDHRLSSTVTLTLAGLLGLAACDPASPDGVPEPRGASIDDTSVWSCLTDTSVTLMHDDGTLDLSSEFAADLAAYARPNDIVEVAFTASDECLAAYGPQISLVAATQQIVSEGQGYGIFLWAVDTAKFTTGAGALAVHLPDRAVQISLAFGEPPADQEEVDADALTIIWSATALE